MDLVALKALAGFNYIRPDAVVAIRATDPAKCDVFLAGGVIIPCSEPAASVIGKIEQYEKTAAESANKEG
jgi:hypothetical protein